MRERRDAKAPPTLITADEAARLTKVTGRPVHPCGTEKGYRRHIAAKENTDPNCRWAHALYKAQVRHAKAVAAGEASGPFDMARWVWRHRQIDEVVHGTPAAYQRHYALGEPICYKCRIANALRQREQRNKRKLEGRPAKGGSANRKPKE